MAEYLGVDSLGALRALPAQDIVNAASRAELYFAPVVDGYYMPDDYRNLAGQANQVPVMVGSTKNDGLGWVDPPTTDEQYASDLAHLFFDLAPAVAAAYPGYGQFDFVTTTSGFTEPARFTARAAQAQGLPTYRYVFDYFPDTARGLLWGAHHDVELPYLFGSLTTEEGYGDQDFSLSERMMDYWIAFADKGDPNPAGQAEWPVYGPEENILFISPVPMVGQGYYEGDCDLFESLAPQTTPDYPGAM